MEMRRPERLTSGHDLSLFSSGEEALDSWFRKRALKNEGVDSRTYVVCEVQRVVGFFTLVAGSVQHGFATGKVRRNAPDPIPVMVLGRLAVDVAYQNRNIGRGLLKEAILRCLQVKEIIGVRALLVHAKSDRAKSFYLRQGFSESPIDPMILMVVL